MTTTDFFDTSWLVAAWEAPENGQANAHSLRVWNTRRKGSAIAAHTLAEIFHYFTGRREQYPGAFVEKLEQNLEGVTVVALTSTEYWSVLARAKATGVEGRAIYDALLLAAARKCAASAIWTRNETAWRNYAPDLAGRIHGLQD